MPLHVTWGQIALRLIVAAVASLLIGLNRDELGNPAGIRTTMLVCLAAALAMIQVNLLLPLAGKPPNSFVVMDVMRLPLGILSGIGFIGAGVIVKRDETVSGVTTAATMWFVTVLGLLLGGGNLYLGIAGSAIAIIVLWTLKILEKRIPRAYRATLNVSAGEGEQVDLQIRELLLNGGLKIAHWNPDYAPPGRLVYLSCEVRWKAPPCKAMMTPAVFN